MKLSNMKAGAKLDLKQQVMSYKRGQFVQGLKQKPGTDKYEEARSKLMGLQGIIEKEDPGFMKERDGYIDFLKSKTSKHQKTEPGSGPTSD